MDQNTKDKIDGLLSQKASTLKELSKDWKERIPLVQIETPAFGYDKYVEEVIGGSQRFCTVDAIIRYKSNLLFIEFKRGFFREFEPDRFGTPTEECESCHKYVDQYKKLFKRSIDLHHKLLKQSLQLKAMESYFVFSEIIAPQLEIDMDNVKVQLIVVSDGRDRPEDDYEEIGQELSSGHSIQSVRRCLSRYGQPHPNRNKPLLYNAIYSYQPTSFEAFMSTLNQA